MAEFHVHLISDSTGETLETIVRAAVVQFEGVEVNRHLWSLIHTKRQMERVVARIEHDPGVVLFTLVSRDLRATLEDGCRRLGLPCVAVLDPVIGVLGNHFGTEMKEMPGRQHVMDADYFGRIEAMRYVMTHDDGQLVAELGEADVVLVGVSRTSKTPTCIYLANRGVKAANVPLVPGMALPGELERVDGPLIVALTANPQRLVEIRRHRLLSLKQNSETDYVDPEMVKAEVTAARGIYRRHGWPVIDVTRRSIEETAAAILQLDARRVEG